MRGRASAAVRRFAPIGVCAAICLLLAQCSNSGRIDARYGVSASPRVVDPGEPVPKGGGTYRVGAPYVVGGRVYVPEQDPHYQAVGLASWYGDDFHGRYTANGEIFDLNGISAAHPTLPLPSYAAGDEPRQRPLAHRPRQRSRTLYRQPHHRRICQGSAAFWVSTIAAPPWCASNMSAARRWRGLTIASWRRPCGRTSPRRRRVASGSPQRQSFRLRRHPLSARNALFCERIGQ